MKLRVSTTCTSAGARTGNELGNANKINHNYICDIIFYYTLGGKGTQITVFNLYVG